MSTKQLPRETVRDLLGIARALYVVRDNQGASHAELDRIREVSAWLIDALELSRTAPASLGHRSAWAKAERATSALTALMLSHDEQTKRLVGAWAERFRSKPMREGNLALLERYDTPLAGRLPARPRRD